MWNVREEWRSPDGTDELSHDQQREGFDWWPCRRGLGCRPWRLMSILVVTTIIMVGNYLRVGL